MSEQKMIDVEDVVEDATPVTPLIQKLRNDKKALEKQIKAMALEIGDQQDMMDMISGALESITPLPPVAYIPKNRQIDHPMSAVAVFSDWHIGEVVKPSETESFNAFDWAIAQKRCHYFSKIFTDWVTVQQSVADIKELVVVVVGDMISGDIHHELVAGNEWPAPEQAIRAGCLLAKTIAQLAPHFEKVRVEYIVVDNHSRMTRKPQFKGGGENSYGNIVGFVAKERLRKHKSVSFNLYKSIQEVIDIRGWRYLCTHGNTIRGWAGIPFYGIDRKVSKEAKARRRERLENIFDKLIMGHYHTPMRSVDFLMNGSLSGTTEFDHGCGRHSDPCQVGFLVHPKIGEVQWNEFFLHHADEMDFSDKEIVAL